MSPKCAIFDAYLVHRYVIDTELGVRVSSRRVAQLPERNGTNAAKCSTMLNELSL